MKKLGFLALLLSVSVYSVGCGETKTAPVAPAPAVEPAPAADATEPAADADHAHAAGETHAEGETK